MDAMGPTTCFPGGGSITIPNVEIMESNYPVLYVHRRIYQDGGGAGKFRGSAGLEVPLKPEGDGFTSSSYRLGPDGDAAFKARLEQRTRGIPVVIPCISTALALRTLGARRFALIGPPWYESELNRMGAEYFRGQGFDAVYAASVDLPGGGKLEDWKTGLHVEPGHLYKWIRAHVPQNADVIFIGGNGMRTIGAIQALEEDLGRPVLTATQVAFWHALHLVGVRATISNYGQIFTKELPLQDAEEL